MELIFLMVLFTTPDNPKPHFEHDWGPREAPTVEECVKRRDNLHRYLTGVTNPDHTRFKVFCTVTEMHGYDEALQAFFVELSAPI
jgi:hypothetical protein